jgi:N,N-dimethylformamidase beta subunit-like protein
MLRLLGYGDRLSVEPGQTIRFMVSCDHPEYESRLVRLIHGDENPEGPGFKQVEIDSPMDGRHPGRHQAIRSGSYVEIPLPVGAVGPSLAFSVYLAPTNPAAGEQVIASIGDPYGGSGWALALSEAGAVELVVGSTRISTGAAVDRWAWYRVECTVDDGWATVRQTPLRSWPDDRSAGEGVGKVVLPALEGSLILGAVRTADGMSRHLDGKLDDPVLDGVGAWDLAPDVSTERVTDRSPHGLHGWSVNMPTRAVTGHTFDGTVTDYHLAPDQYSAIHVHRDDLEDAAWEVDLELTVPDGLPSGVYAAWLRAGDDEDHIPFTVRPSRGHAGSRIAVLMSTLTYTVYANFTDLGPGAWQQDTTKMWPSGAPHADPTLLRDVYHYIDENALYGIYDLHLDGSGVVYGSYLRPILNMRPKFRYRIWAAPPRFPADLYLVDWLDHFGIEADFITDHDLAAEGAALLEPYAVVVSSSHHEYWSSGMLDGLEKYLGGGGRFMLLGGNSLYGVASFDPDPARPHVVEVRRWGAAWPFEVPPGERVHSTTGEPGGSWRNRGRPPNGIVGVGTSAAGFDQAVPYRRMPDSYDPRVGFIFEGIGPDELIGNQPNLQTRWGAAGYEIDRFDHELGTPASALLLASSVGFSDLYRPMVEEVLWYVMGRDGARPDDPQVEGEPHRFVRSDMAYLEYPNGGAAFSVGSIAWRGGIAHNGYENTVSRVTSNVLRRFAERPRGVSPSDPA